MKYFIFNTWYVYKHLNSLSHLEDLLYTDYAHPIEARFSDPPALHYSSSPSSSYYQSPPCQNSNNKIPKFQICLLLFLVIIFFILVPPVSELLVKGCHLQIPPTVDIPFFLWALKGTFNQTCWTGKECKWKYNPKSSLVLFSASLIWGVLLCVN